jgi:hypothetical protein
MISVAADRARGIVASARYKNRLPARVTLGLGQQGINPRTNDLGNFAQSRPLVRGADRAMKLNNTWEDIV